MIPLTKVAGPGAWVPAMLAVAAALGVSGCGEATSTSANLKGEAHAVAQALSNFQSDASTGNVKDICQKYLASSLKRKLERGGVGCSKALEEQLREVDTFTLDVESVSVDGAKASAQVRSTYSGKLKPSTLSLQKEGDSWKITGTG